MKVNSTLNSQQRKSLRSLKSVSAALISIHNTIQIIKAYLQKRDLFVQIKDAWQHVKKSTLREKNILWKVNISVILLSIAHQLKDLISIVQNMINNKDVFTESTSYAKALKSFMRISKKKVLRRIQSVSVKHSRKLMIKSKQKTMKQKRRTSVKIVQNINKKIKEQEKMIAAQNCQVRTS